MKTMKYKNDKCDIMKMKMKDLAINTILILEVQMINKPMDNDYKSEKIGMQRSKDDLLRVSAKST